MLLAFARLLILSTSLDIDDVNVVLLCSSQLLFQQEEEEHKENDDEFFDDDDAKNDDFFSILGKIVREYEAQSFITPTKECAEQKPNNDRKGGRERGQNRRYHYPSPGRSERFKTPRHNLAVDHADFTNVRG